MGNDSDQPPDSVNEAQDIQAFIERLKRTTEALEATIRALKESRPDSERDVA